MRNPLMAAPWSAALALLLGAASAARAGIVSPGQCTVPVVFVGSPDGSLVASVIARDIANNPVRGASISLDFSGCAAFRPCPTVCTDCVVNAVTKFVSKPTDANGVAAFDLRLGGSSCPNPPVVHVFADGFMLGGTPAFASLDQDGDLSVTAADAASVHALIGTGDRRADFDGNGIVTAADEAIVTAHLGATCDPTTPSSHPTWGALKTIYR